MDFNNKGLAQGTHNPSGGDGLTQRREERNAAALLQAFVV
jgi:hypothetical protein